MALPGVPASSTDAGNVLFSSEKKSREFTLQPEKPASSSQIDTIRKISIRPDLAEQMASGCSIYALRVQVHE